METKFFARTTFRYGATVFYPGMEWKPTGGKHDSKIIGSRLVRAEIVEAAPEGATDDKKESRNRVDVHIDNNRGSRKRGDGVRHSRVDTDQVNPGN